MTNTEPYATTQQAEVADATAQSSSSLRLLEGTGTDREEWLRRLRDWPERDVFADPAYLDLFCQPGERPGCFAYESARGTVLYPVMRKDLRATPFWDGDESLDVGPPPFGYAGPFVVGAADERARQLLLAEFYEHYRGWARRAGLVAEYTLFTPFEEAPTSYPGESAIRLPVVVRTLDAGEDQIWADYRHGVRKAVRAAVRNDVTVTVDLEGTYAQEFLDIHLHTMDRQQGVESHRLSVALLDRLHRTLDGRYAYMHAWQDGRVISSHLLLVSATTVYAFRGGTLADKLNTRANQILKHEAIVWSKRQGKRSYMLGGGVTGEDSLLAYKASFAPAGVRPLWAGRWLLDPERHAELTEARRLHEAGRGVEWVPAPGFFPAYRAPMAEPD